MSCVGAKAWCHCEAEEFAQRMSLAVAISEESWQSRLPRIRRFATQISHARNDTWGVSSVRAGADSIGLMG